MDKQMSMLEVAEKLMKDKKTPQTITDLIKEVLEVKGLDDLDGVYSTQLYVDITASSKFVYMGDDKWDLKTRQSLDEYDKDGSAFNNDVEDDTDDVSVSDYNLDETPQEDEDAEITSDIDEYEDEDDDSADATGLEEFDDIRENPDEDDDFDEKDYDEIMDDYEDLYDKE